MAHEVCLNVVVTGKVQNFGFREFTVNLANILGLKGYVFNDVDGTVKMVVAGNKEEILGFLNELKSKSGKTGAVIEEINFSEIGATVFLPPKFVKLETEEVMDLARKFDKGIEILREIKNNTEAIPRVESAIQEMNVKLGKLDSIEGSIQEMNVKLGKLDNVEKGINELNTSIKSNTEYLRKVGEAILEILKKKSMEE